MYCQFNEGGNVLVQLCPRFLTHFLQILTAPPGTHGPRIALVEGFLAFLDLDVGVLARDDDGAAALAGEEVGAFERLRGGPVFVDGGGG